jgi:beta-glucosidase
MDFIQDGDMDAISRPMDNVGINYYSHTIVRDARAKDNLPVTLKPDDWQMEIHNWEVAPGGLFDILMRLHYDYKFPKLYVTENGAAFPDEVSADGAVHDEERRKYLELHFIQAARAMQAGVNLGGYFVWSLLDNFEWAFGYRMRFGIIHVDFETQQRTLKDSAQWYAKVIANNGLG